MRKRILRVLCLVVASTVARAVHADTPTKPVTVAFGETTAIEELAGLDSVTATADPTDLVEFTAPNTLHGKRAGSGRVTFQQGGQDKLIANVTVTPADLDIELVQTKGGHAEIPVTNQEIRVVAGDEYHLTLTPANPNGPPGPFQATAVTPSMNFVQVDGQGNIAIGDPPTDNVVNPPPTPVSITFTTNDGATRTIRLLVIDAIDELRIDLPTVITENQQIVVPVTIIGKGGGTYNSDTPAFAGMYEYDCALSIAGSEVSSTHLKPATFKISRIANPAAKPQATVQCSANVVGRADPTPSARKQISIVASGGAIEFVPAVVTVVAGQAAALRARVVDRLGQEQENAKVRWSLASPSDGAVLTTNTDTEASLLTLSDPAKLPENGVLTVHATTEVNGLAISGDLPVRVTSPAFFKRVSGSLELLDYQTARDLYGTQTINDFYVAKITLLNDLQDEPNRKLVGASILVFSSSLEIGVNMEKTEGGSRPPVKNASWSPVTFGDLRALGLPAAYPIKAYQARPNIVTPPRDRNGKTLLDDLDSAPVYTCDDIWFAQQEIEMPDGSEHLAQEQIDALRAKLIRQRDAQVSAARLRQLHYRPYPYDMVVKSFDPRDNRTARSWTFRALTFAGSFASFLSGVPQFKASDEFIAFNEKFATGLVPALGVLWPSLKETQRQNLVSDTMHPIEEIPYASSLTKVVFLPKYAFPGFKAKHWFRISEVCPFNFQIDVAVAPKRETETVVPPAR